MIDFLKDFVKMSENEVKSKLKGFSDKEISYIAEAYFSSRDGEYNEAHYFNCYGGVDVVKQKLQTVAYPTLISNINTFIDKN